MPIRSLLSWCACAALVYANDTSLAEMIVSADKSAVDVNLPASTASVTAGIINDTVNLVETEDALKYLPSVQVRKRYIGDRNGIIVTRTSGSLASARSLVYADGVLLSNLLGNSYAFPPRWAMVTPEEIERMDLIYGPFAAEYPGNSAGNTLLIATKMPGKFQGHVETQAFAEDFRLYGTDKTYTGNQSALSLGNKNGDLSWLLTYNHLDSHGHPMTFATFAPSTTDGTGSTVITGAYKDKDTANNDRIIVGATGIDHTVQDTAKLKLAYDLTPTSKLTYTFGYWQNASTGDVSSYLKDASGNTVSSGTVSLDGKKYDLKNAFKPTLTDEKHLMQALTYKTHISQEWGMEAIASVYDYTTSETRTPGISGGTAGTLTDQSGSGWKTLDLKFDYRPAAAKGHRIKFGYHFDRYLLESETYNTANWQSGAATTFNSAFKGKTQTRALYVQDAWTFLPEYRLIAGGRFEKWEAYDGLLAKGAVSTGFEERNERYFSPKLALEHTIDAWLLRASAGRSVRMPTVSELFQGSFDGSNNLINNDPNLKPEDALTYELSAERDLGTGLLRTSAFYERMSDALYSQTYANNGGGTTTNIQNVDRIVSKGIELAYSQTDALTDGFDLFGSLTYADSEVTKNRLNPAYVGKKQVRIPDWRATAGATYRQSKNLNYTLAARYSGKQYTNMDNSDVNNNTYGGNSDFLIVDAKLKYRLDNGFGISAGVDNLTDCKAYAYHPYSQRTFFVKAQYDF